MKAEDRCSIPALIDQWIFFYIFLVRWSTHRLLSSHWHKQTIDHRFVSTAMICYYSGVCSHLQWWTNNCMVYYKSELFWRETSMLFDHCIERYFESNFLDVNGCYQIENDTQKLEKNFGNENDYVRCSVWVSWHITLFFHQNIFVQIFSKQISN